MTTKEQTPLDLPRMKDWRSIRLLELEPMIDELIGEVERLTLENYECQDNEAAAIGRLTAANARAERLGEALEEAHKVIHGRFCDPHPMGQCQACLDIQEAIAANKALADDAKEGM